MAAHLPPDRRCQHRSSIQQLSGLFSPMRQLVAIVPTFIPSTAPATSVQLYDVEIDRINKPYLPLAAGDFTLGTGQAIVAATGAASLAIGAAAASPPLLATLGGSLALGIAYSTDLPFLRWKRSPVLAASCILAVR